MRRTLLLALLLCIPLIAEEICEAGYTSRIGIKHQEHRGVGYDTGYSTLFAFVSPEWDQFLPFLDARAHLFNDGRFASNLGIGARLPAFDNACAFGANLYWDYRNSKGLNTNQIGPGLEILSRDVDFRINGYIPLSGQQYTGKLKLAKCIGNQAIIKQTTRLALPNINAELGFPLPWKWMRVVDLYFAIGPYYLFKEVGKKASARQLALGVIPPRQPNKAGDSFGMRARMTARVCDGLMLAIESTYDSTFHGTVQGYIAFSLPFGPANMKTQGVRWKARYQAPQCSEQAYVRRMLTQSVDRFEIIPVDTKTRSLNSVNDCSDVITLLHIPPEVLASFAPEPSLEAARAAALGHAHAPALLEAERLTYDKVFEWIVTNFKEGVYEPLRAEYLRRKESQK